MYYANSIKVFNKSIGNSLRKWFPWEEFKRVR